MGALFLLNGIVALLISILLAWGFFKHYMKDYIKRVTNWFSIIFFGYIILFILSISWSFGFLSYNVNDFNFIYSIAIFAQTLILFKVVYSFNKNKSMFYLLFFYLVSFLSATFSLSYFPLFVLIISFFLTLILSFNFISTSAVCKRVGHVGIFYACISLILEFLLFFRVGEPFLFSLISNSIFLVFVFFFLKDVKRYPLKFVEQIPTKEESHIMLFIKYFVYIIVLTNFVLISTIGVHEFSHVAASRYYDCESRSIVFEKGLYPYSEIICDDLSGKLPIALAGFVVPIVIALILFIIGGRFIRPVSLLIIGFNFLASYKDFQELGVGENIILTSSIIGIVFLFIGIAFLAKSRMHEHHHFHLGHYL